MKSILFVLVILIFAARLPAQTDVPVRLALVSESDEASAVVDVLTAELSGHKNLELLERNEIERVYHEQGLSAGNQDYLKLGQILGADGLLLLDVVRTPQATNLMARLIAVKPGVILTDGSFAWPLKDTAQWAESVSSYLDLLLPKLSVPAKDAIPISVVNLRSAVASAEGAETERQLKLLVIQRLSQERELFVLERQKMQLLSEEKELKADDSAFWNGSYLLEGVVDQSGYSKDTVTINARLTPSKGGTPLMMEVSGSRTNLAAVVNQLALEVTKALKIKSEVKEWNAADEAAQYFAEAQWALRWGAYSEAQAAADSAWTLGEKDLACALVRVKSYMLEVSANVRVYEIMEESYGAEGGYDVNGKPVGNLPSESRIQSDIQKMLTEHPRGIAYNEKQDEFQKSQEAKSVRYAYSSEPPDPKNIDRALHALELYYEFSRTSSDGEPKIIWRGAGWTDWHNSDWYQLGIDDLVAVSKVLQDFNLDPKSQRSVTEKLAELRALTRLVAGLVSQSPSVHDSYFVGDRIATSDELNYTIKENPNIFRCEVKWGCFWQETPEDCVALYRNLMNSPVFCYIHDDFWSPELPTPRLTAWNEQDRKRIPAVWNDFVQELGSSTNVLWRMEAKALAMADATSYEQSQSARNALFEIIRSNRTELVANNVELFYRGWGLGYLNPELDAMDQEYRDKTIPARQTALAFEKQKKYLANFTPYKFQTFQNTFAVRSFTKAQAVELLPLIAAYKSNLIARASSTPEKFKAQADAQWIAVFLERGVDEIVNPPQPPPAPARIQTPPKPVAIAKIAAPFPVSTDPSEIVTNVITVSKFLPIPLDGLPGDQISGVTVTAHHWLEGKLLLDFQYGAFLYSFDAKSNWQQTRSVTFPAIAILDPAAEHWNVISCPEVNIMAQSHFYHRSTLWRGQLFNCDDGQIKKYDFAGRQWQVLPVSDGGNYELFTVNDRLYAANRNMIFEIIDDGKSTRILASNRRNPPVSKLDAEDLGMPTLFEGPDHSLRVCVKSKIFTWVGDDWREGGAAPPFTFQPGIFTDGALFRQSEGGYSKPDSLNFLAVETNAAELWLSQKVQSPNQASFNNFSRTSEHKAKELEPLWKMPANLALANLPAAAYESNLYLLVDHSEVQDIVNEQQHELIGKKILLKDGYNAALLCFSHDLPLPQKLFLKFDAPDGCPPVTGINPDSRQVFPGAPPVWLFFTTNFLICGLEKPDNFMPNGVGNIGIGRKTGIWLLPLPQISAVLAGQKQAELEQMAQAAASVEQSRKNLLARIDLNHNGIIDQDEREAALGDPAFIASELDVIDTNHNGWLDAKELVYFDANNNKILEPKEQAGIEIAQRLFAEKLLKKFDANGDGALDRPEFNDLVQSGPNTNARPIPGFPVQFPDENHDGKIDVTELEAFLKQQLRKEIRPRGTKGGAGYFNQMIQESKKVDAGQSFKVYVELSGRIPAAPRTNQQTTKRNEQKLCFFKGLIVPNRHIKWK